MDDWPFEWPDLRSTEPMAARTFGPLIESLVLGDERAGFYRPAIEGLVEGLELEEIAWFRAAGIQIPMAVDALERALSWPLGAIREGTQPIARMPGDNPRRIAPASDLRPRPAWGPDAQDVVEFLSRLARLAPRTVAPLLDARLSWASPDEALAVGAMLGLGDADGMSLQDVVNGLLGAFHIRGSVRMAGDKIVEGR